MKVVGFDTATDHTVIAAVGETGIVFELTVGPGEDGRPTHSATLLEGVSHAAEALGGWDEVDRLAVGIGPGTFTGLRIGIATATGLALSTGVQLAGASTLAALAINLSAAGQARRLCVPVLDAKRNEVFVAVYDEQGERIRPEVAVAPEAAIETVLGLDAPVTVGGPGAVRFADLFDQAGIAVVDPESRWGRLDGAAICEVGATVAPASPVNPLKPTYIRAPDAQLWLKRNESKPPG